MFKHLLVSLSCESERWLLGLLPGLEREAFSTICLSNDSPIQTINLHNELHNEDFSHD